MAGKQNKTCPTCGTEFATYDATQRFCSRKCKRGCTGPAPRDAKELFFEHVRKLENGCWEWTGALTPSGYGVFGGDRAHRVSYEMFVGPIPYGLTLDHTCHKPEECQTGERCPHRRCVNFDHLEPVTTQINTRRGLGSKRGQDAAAKLKRAITHCPKGHEYTPGNTYIHDGKRSCRKCRELADIAAHPRRGPITHCPQGHEYTEANTFVRKEGWRRCRECSRLECAHRRSKAKISTQMNTLNFG